MRPRAKAARSGFSATVLAIPAARPLRRVIQREIEDALSERILFGELKSGEIIVVDVEGEDAEAKFTFKGAPKAMTPDSPEDLAEAPTA